MPRSPCSVGPRRRPSSPAYSGSHCLPAFQWEADTHLGLRSDARCLLQRCDSPATTRGARLSLAAVAELRKRGTVSQSLMEHISVFLNDKCREIDLNASEDMEVTLEDGSLPPSSRDPRIRRKIDVAPTPPAGPTIPLPATTSSATPSQSGSSFADALKTGATAAATT